MYYEIDGIYELPTVFFEEDRLIVGKREYPYDKISSIKITNSVAFAVYAIFKIRYEGKEINIPFNRHHLKTARHAVDEFNHLKQKEKEAKEHPVMEQVQTSSIPYNDLKELKELLDEGIITEEEFNAKKKQLLGLE